MLRVRLTLPRAGGLWGLVSFNGQHWWLRSEVTAVSFMLGLPPAPRSHFLVSSIAFVVVISQSLFLTPLQCGGSVLSTGVRWSPMSGCRMQGSPQFTGYRDRKTGDCHRGCQGPVGTQQPASLARVGLVGGGFLENVMLKLGPRGGAGRAGGAAGASRVL